MKMVLYLLLNILTIKVLHPDDLHMIIICMMATAMLAMFYYILYRQYEIDDIVYNNIEGELKRIILVETHGLYDDNAFDQAFIKYFNRKAEIIAPFIKESYYQDPAFFYSDTVSTRIGSINIDLYLDKPFQFNPLMSKKIYHSNERYFAKFLEKLPRKRGNKRQYRRMIKEIAIDMFTLHIKDCMKIQKKYRPEMMQQWRTYILNDQTRFNAKLQSL